MLTLLMEEGEPEDEVKVNNMRVAEVWLDDFRNYFYEASDFVLPPFGEGAWQARWVASSCPGPARAGGSREQRISCSWKSERRPMLLLAQWPPRSAEPAVAPAWQ